MDFIELAVEWGLDGAKMEKRKGSTFCWLKTNGKNENLLYSYDTICDTCVQEECLFAANSVALNSIVKEVHRILSGLPIFKIL